MSWADDKAWSDQYMPLVCAIVGPRLLVPAPIERDRNENTDLTVLRARDMTIAVRLRRDIVGRYPGQFTLRSRRTSGAVTELTKVIDGWGDWFFYGKIDTDKTMPEWMLVDLHKLRATFIRYPNILHNPDNRSSGRTTNFDNATEFMWFHAPSLKRDVVIAQQLPAAAMTDAVA